MIGAEALLKWVRGSEEFGQHFPVGNAADLALEQREEPEAEQSWLTAHAEVRKLVESIGRPQDREPLVQAIAEFAFRRAFDISQQHHEFAAQVSEDFELLAEADIAGYTSATLEGLWAAYASGEFPAR